MIVDTQNISLSINTLFEEPKKEGAKKEDNKK